MHVKAFETVPEPLEVFNSARSESLSTEWFRQRIFLVFVVNCDFMSN
jgi:hypothetical protein